MQHDNDQLVVASNRGPVSWRADADGELHAYRGFGGLVTALGGALQEEPGTWISVALSDTDREMAARHEGKPFTVEADGNSYKVRLLDAGARFDAYYNDVSNRLLWFTLHGLWPGSADVDEAAWLQPWQDAYEPVNHAVADAVVDAAEAGAEVFLQDYHLAVAGTPVRERLPGAAILQYLHTPWPGPVAFTHLPLPLTQSLLRGLLSADVLALSSPAWCDGFRRCAMEYLGAHIEGDAVVYRGRRTVLESFVLGVDADDLAASAAAPDTLAASERLEAQRDGRQLIVRVDRTDLSKNILRGLAAYELLLERHAEHRGRIWHYVHLNPSRQAVPEYRDYLVACQEAAARIHERFGEQCLTVFVGDDYATAVAALRSNDVLVTNPIMDGTNLVAKEGPALNVRDGVLILSRDAGAADVMGDAALVVDPYDVEELADALHQALLMPADARAARAARLREAAHIGSPQEWFAAQRRVLRQAVAARP